MADSTFGVKVPDDLKDQLTKLMQDSGLTGKDFMQSLVNVYQVEKTKEEIPGVAQDLKELQGLTQRINNIYLNLGYRIDNLMKSKETEMQDQLQLKDKLIFDLQSKNESLNIEKDTLVEAFNTSVNDKNELNEKVNQLTNMYNDNKALVEEYKEKNDTLTGLVNEYKGYKTEIEEYKKLLADSQSRNVELENTLKDKDFELIKINDSLLDLKTKNEAAIEDLKTKHKDEIGSLNNKITEIQEHHKANIQSVKDKAEFEKDKALLDQDKKNQENINRLNEAHNQKVVELLASNEEQNKKIRELLEQLAEVKKQQPEPAKTPKKLTTTKETK